MDLVFRIHSIPKIYSYDLSNDKLFKIIDEQQFNDRILKHSAKFEFEQICLDDLIIAFNDLKQYQLEVRMAY